MESGPLWTILGVIIATFVPALKDFIFNYYKERSVSTYSAIRIVCVLESYAEECVSAAADDGEPQISDDGQCDTRIAAKDPVLLSFAADVDWKSIDANLAYQVLNFSNVIAQAESAMRFAYNMLDDDEAFEERNFQYAVLGTTSLEISDELRRRYSLGARISQGWNSSDFFRRLISRIKKKRGIEEDHYVSWYQKRK